LRESLWLTHERVNRAVAEIENALLLCRGRGYTKFDDEAVSASEVQRQAVEFARQVQRKNGKTGAGSDAELLGVMGRLYEALVPSVLTNEQGEPMPGESQAAGGFAGPLMDSRSEGFLSVFDKVLDPPPTWIERMSESQSGWEAESTAWLATSQSQTLQRASGSPPSWVRKMRSGSPWQEAFVADQTKKRSEVQGIPSLVRQMKSELGLLPMFSPPITSQFANPQSGLTPWDRLALRLAVGHLLSWESWNHRAAAEFAKTRERVESQREELATFGPLAQRLREYERQRHDQLERVALATDDNPFRIGMRMVRGWDRVQEAWQGSGGTNRDTRLAALAILQAKLAGKFGDPDLFRWLAEDGREELWRNRSVLMTLARLNAVENLLRRKKDHAIYTPPDARLHPRWVGYEPLGGSNLRNYELVIGPSETLVVMPLLSCQGSGLVEETFRVPLAPSGQLSNPAWAGRVVGERRLEFWSARQQFTAQLAGSEFFLDRRRLENRETDALANGDIGPVWFKLVLDIDFKGPADWCDSRGRVVTPPAVYHFNSGLATTSKHGNALEPGLRVLSVDLGVRDFAACSVFELVQGKPERGLSFIADAKRDLWAKHERSFLLALPGEKPNEGDLTGRSAAYDQLGLLRRDLNRLRDILRLKICEAPTDRVTALADLRASLETESAAGRASSFDLPMIESLDSAQSQSQPIWEAAVDRVYRDAEARLSGQLGSWRKQSRPRAVAGLDRRERRGYRGGKSAWNIEYLEGVRRLLQGWSLRGRQRGQINRADRQRRGVFAAGLLKHINGLKRDRTKSGSDFLVQAARGYLPGKLCGWERKFEPCRLILFEDLARYQFRTDRPRRENARLMRWSHREIRSEVEQQAALYGIVVTATGAGFTSRFHATTGAPGCRTRVLSDEDLTSPAVVTQLGFLAERLRVDPTAFRPGMRVPWDSGNEFATLGPDGHLVVIHADINAAQNLQRRFWTRHGDAYRVSVVQAALKDRAAWYPDAEGTRLRGALTRLIGGDGYSRLVPSADDDGLILERVPRKHWREVVGSDQSNNIDGEIDELELELAEWADTEPAVRQGEKTVLFRDPSGHVLRSDRWYESKEFWGRVHRRIASALRIVGG
jgi:hypothetical protein